MQWKLATPVAAWALFAGVAGALAQDSSIAIKNGETLEMERLYWVGNCKSILKAPPTAEILDGPPNLSVAVKEANLLPYRQNCSKTVPGGLLYISAKDVSAVSTARLVVRVKYVTKDGDRVRAYTYRVTMVP